MAMNWQVFRTRALTALVFVVVMLAGVLYNQVGFFLLFSIIHLGCWYEFLKLIKKIDPSYKAVSNFHKVGIILLGWAFMLYAGGKDIAVAGVTMQEIGLWIGLILIFALPVTEILFVDEFSIKHIAFSVLGLMYISFSWALLVHIRDLDFSWTSGSGTVFNAGWLIPILMIVSIWINDTMAYVTGSFIGKTPFSKVSPKKTIEGTVGGVILCVGVMAAWAVYMQLHLWDVAIIALIAAVMGTAGDLMESKLKRMAGVKDSGSFMPGHGGFLDRFDSLLVATPAVWLYVMLIMK